MKYGIEVATTEKQREDSRITIKETLENNAFDMNLLKDVVEIPIYASNELTGEDFFKSNLINRRNERTKIASCKL